MEQIKKDVLIIGAGAAGLGTAIGLMRRGQRSVAVLEQERRVGVHASGRNAGMIRQAIAEPLIARLAIEGRNVLAALENRRWPCVCFRPIGSLLLAKGKECRQLVRIEKALNSNQVISCRYTRQEAGVAVPILKGADFTKGLFCPSDAVIEIEPLLKNMVRQLAEKKIPVYFGHRVETLQKKGEFFYATAGGRHFKAKKIINAAGAWASLIGQKVDAAPVKLTAYRRHLYESGPFAKADGRWPFVWNLTDNFYFRPEKKGLMTSPCDQQAVEIESGRSIAGYEQPDVSMEKEMMRRLCRFWPGFRSLSIARAKAGLRTISGDGQFVIGEDPKQEDFYWLAGLGGHGMTTAFAVGRVMAELVTSGRMDPAFKKAFAPGRFIR